jgi:hypothetical protein
VTESFDDLPVPDSLIQPLFDKTPKKSENMAENLIVQELYNSTTKTPQADGMGLGQ